MEMDDEINRGDIEDRVEFQLSQAATLETDRGANEVNEGGQVEFQLNRHASGRTNYRPNQSKMNDQEDHPISDTSGLNTNADLANSVFMSRSPDLANIYYEHLDRATSIVLKHTGHDQLRHHIQDLGERLDQQEQLRQQQTQLDQEEAVLVQSLLGRQGSLEAQMTCLQTQLQALQTELASQQDSHFSVLVAMIHEMSSGRTEHRGE